MHVCTTVGHRLFITIDTRFIGMASKDAGVEYTYLGKSGLKVSNMCLGAMTFGQHPDTFPTWPSQADETKAYSIMSRYVELGGNFIDTANIYSRGVSEQILGKWLKTQKRDKIVIATKVRCRMDDGPNDIGLSRRHIVQMCEESLQRLCTDYIDLYQTHLWDDAVPIEETLRTLDDLVRCGKVRYIGVSNVIGWQMQKIVDLVNYMGLTPVVSLQQQYSLLCRHSEVEEFQVCKNEGIGVLPWSPLKGGILTGKYKRQTTPSLHGTRISHSTEKNATSQAAPSWNKYADNQFYWNLMDTLQSIAKSHDKTVAQVSLRWLLQKDIVSSVIFGATSIEQLENNMGAGTGWHLTSQEMALLDEVSRVELPYPYEMVFRMNTDRVNRFMTSSLVGNKLS